MTLLSNNYVCKKKSWTLQPKNVWSYIVIESDDLVDTECARKERHL